MSNFKKYRSRMIVTLITIILLVVIGFSSKDRDKITFIENKIGVVITPVQKVFYNIGESIFDMFGSVVNLSKLSEENVFLKKKLAKLENENRQMEDIISRSDYLKNEAEIKKKSEYNLLKSQIVSKDPGNWFNKFIIDKGIKDGVSIGDCVIQGIEFEDNIIEEGLVGRIIDVGDNWSKVISIIDKGSNVSFKVIRTQDSGVLSGGIQENEGFLFDINADIVKGDKLLTSGLGEVYIKDLYIGKISEVIKKEDELIKKITVKPVVNFKKLNNVFVIINEK